MLGPTTWTEPGPHARIALRHRRQAQLGGAWLLAQLVTASAHRVALPRHGRWPRSARSMRAHLLVRALCQQKRSQRVLWAAPAARRARGGGELVWRAPPAAGPPWHRGAPLPCAWRTACEAAGAVKRKWGLLGEAWDHAEKKPGHGSAPKPASTGGLATACTHASGDARTAEHTGLGAQAARRHPRCKGIRAAKASALRFGVEPCTGKLPG